MQKLKDLWDKDYAFNWVYNTLMLEVAWTLCVG
jgi:hypothetical protein